jgi:hypothetical protein
VAGPILDWGKKEVKRERRVGEKRKKKKNEWLGENPKGRLSRIERKNEKYLGFILLPFVTLFDLHLWFHVYSILI